VRQPVPHSDQVQAADLDEGAAHVDQRRIVQFLAFLVHGAHTAFRGRCTDLGLLGGNEIVGIRHDHFFAFNGTDGCRGLCRGPSLDNGRAEIGAFVQIDDGIRLQLTDRMLKRAPGSFLRSVRPVIASRADMECLPFDLEAQIGRCAGDGQFSDASPSRQQLMARQPDVPRLRTVSGSRFRWWGRR